jgi:hypothetical protein
MQMLFYFFAVMGVLLIVSLYVKLYVGRWLCWRRLCVGDDQMDERVLRSEGSEKKEMERMWMEDWIVWMDEWVRGWKRNWWWLFEWIDRNLTELLWWGIRAGQPFLEICAWREHTDFVAATLLSLNFQDGMCCLAGRFWRLSGYRLFLP